MARAAFTGYHIDPQLDVELDPETSLPTRLRCWDGKHKLRVEGDNNTHYIYVHGGPDAEAALVVWRQGKSFSLEPGMFAVVPGPMTIIGGTGVAITREAYTGLFMIGGPIEETGRLKYIDGCTDTLLASPPRKGDPCLNLLYFPEGIDQTEHTHPSVRAGMVMSGRGRVIYEDVDGLDAAEDLEPGMIWCIHTGGRHLFQTPYGEAMRVLAYHPDSDHGPSDEEHPMLNRTIVDGVSARDIAEILTK